MTVNEIEDAVRKGKKVHWTTDNYIVDMHTVKGRNFPGTEEVSSEQFDILCLSNDHRVGLTWIDGVTLNGKEEDFYVKD